MTRRRPVAGDRERATREDRAARRDRAADRALFEQAVARLDLAPPDKAGEDAEARLVAAKAPASRPARFTKRAARGGVEPDAKIDLHGLDRETATDRLRLFLSGTRGETVLVVHGRGLGILAAATVVELDRHPRVAEHLPAPPASGGEGARLVRLRRRP